MKDRVSHFTEYMTVLVLGLFALCTVLGVLTGARSYREVVRRSRMADDSRRAVSYLSTRIRQSEGDVSVEPFGEATALVLRETVDGAVYLTRIYCHEGYLKELYTAGSGVFSPSDGEKLFALASLSFREEEKLLYITAVLPNGESRILALHTEKEVLP